MQFPCKTFRVIPGLWKAATQFNHAVVPQARFSSKITPIKMKANVFQTNETDANAPPLIIMHGLFGSKQNWRAISKSLERSTKRKIYSVDARNHGDSPHHPEHTSAHMAEDVLHFMQEENIQRAAVMGHSMGGRTMMYLALKYPHLVEKAIIVDISPVSIPDNFESMKEIFLAMKNISVPSDLSMAEGRPVVESQIRTAVGDNDTVNFIMLNLRKLKTGEFVWGPNVDALYANFSNFRDTSQFSMPPFNGPVLFIGGKYSEFLSPDDWPQIQQIFPNAELKWLNAGHLVHFEKPAEFTEMVTNFLRS